MKLFFVVGEPIVGKESEMVIIFNLLLVDIDGHLFKQNSLLKFREFSHVHETSKTYPWEFSGTVYAVWILNNSFNQNLYLDYYFLEHSFKKMIIGVFIWD